ncbi:MAG: hypothetical protein JWM91_4087 [Rhodospirillales bacterium]|nr:hypothetical protein [Rhodospirillales bacterium]
MVTGTNCADTSGRMLILELALACLSAIWCALVWLYADPPTGSRKPPVPRRIAAALCIVAPVAAGALLSLNGALITAGAVLSFTVAWWMRLSARDIGGWEIEYARVPKAVRDGNLIRVTDIRNFRYGSVEDPILAYYDADYELDSLTSVDLICSYWSGRTIAHVFLSFGFADGRYLAVSVETRRRRGQVYSAIAGFFRHYQLIYVVADERDLIGVRTDTRREQVYLYRLRTSAEERKQLFAGYMERAEALAKRPEFYNTALNNCTSNIVRIIDGGLPRGQRLGRDWRLLLSGYADEFAYSVGRLETGLPFAELKARSLIVRPAGSRISDDFSTAIRETLP